MRDQIRILKPCSSYMHYRDWMKTVNVNKNRMFNTKNCSLFNQTGLDINL
jgi:hypothetical protein